MKVGYSYRLRPTAEQRRALARTFGCARVVYNDALALRLRAHQDGRPWIGLSECQRRVVAGAKKTPERAWLSDVSSVALVQAVRDQDQAWRAFFSSRRRPGRKFGTPRFRSKKERRQSIRLTRNGFAIHPNGRLASIGSEL